MSDKLSDHIKIDDLNDDVLIYDIRYAGSFFRGLGFGLDEGETFSIVERLNGSLVVTQHYDRDDKEETAT